MMITSKMVANPNYRPGARCAMLVRKMVCTCGSADISESYITAPDGDVEGKTLVCRSCGAVASI